ncbi:MAG: hypothetical protein AAB212_01160, partial [Bacteroidota bacterium]
CYTGSNLAKDSGTKKVMDCLFFGSVTWIVICCYLTDCSSFTNHKGNYYRVLAGRATIVLNAVVSMATIF